MQWLQDNWFWFVLAVGFVAMHLFGHGGHRRHGDGSRGWRNPNPVNDATDKPASAHTHPVGSASPIAGSNDPLLRALPAQAGQDNPPPQTDGKRHKHGC